MKEARESLPKAYTVMYTNGLALTPRLLHDLMPSLNILMIDNYADDLKVLPSIRASLAVATQDEADRIILLMRHKHDVLDTRGGQSETRSLKPTLNISCTNPFSEMTVNPDGRVNLCCQDVYTTNEMGNLTSQSIKEVWHGTRFSMARRLMLDHCRDAIPICRECDFIRSTPVADEDIKTYKPVRMEGLPP
jgi:radical SAM protein with 4Fe4S-binding SPASM domain